MKHTHIGKLLPIEGYYVAVKDTVSLHYQQSLTHLYQPLIGVQAVSLYQTLLNEFEIRKEQTKAQTHHSLMSLLSLSLDKIYEARLRLEGIGLLTTYQAISESERKIYTYQLNPPFSPRGFLEDAMLSQLLYHHLGEKKYEEVLQLFLPHSSREKGEEVTAGFNEVFETQLSHFSADLSRDLPVEERSGPDRQGPSISENTLDFSWMEDMLAQRMIPSARILTQRNKKLMVQMAVLYSLTTLELENALLWALNEDNVLDVPEFKSACHDLFQSKRENTSIKLIGKREVSSQETQEKPKSKEEQFVSMLENISPKQLLEDLSGGYQASSQDLKVVSDVMTQQGLPPGVMNVLVHYVLLKTDMKLSKAYLEKIAGHWARKNVQTARQAMDLAKAENQKYLTWGNSKRTYQKPARKEVIPEWFKERKNSNPQPDSEVPEEKERENEEKEIAELLKSYADTQKPSHL